MSIEKFQNRKVSMTIAGLDPSGGAGILADSKSFNAHGVYATCVVCAITAQNPYNVSNIESVDLKLIEDQIDEIVTVYPVEYIKTGMLYNSDIIRLVTKKIKQYQLKAVVDPVMISESGKNLTNETFLDSFKKYLLKNSFLITPNVSEAEKIADTTIKTEDDMIETAFIISKDANVVITGGHMNGNDILIENNNLHKIKGKLIDSNNTHGTGCTYSASVTSNLVLGYNLLDSCIKSRKFIKNSIIDGFYNTPNQFYDLIDFKK